MSCFQETTFDSIIKQDESYFNSNSPCNVYFKYGQFMVRTVQFIDRESLKALSVTGWHTSLFSDEVLKLMCFPQCVHPSNIRRHKYSKTTDHFRLHQNIGHFGWNMNFIKSPSC